MRINGNCLNRSGTLSGSVNGTSVLFGIALDGFSTINYQGNISADKNSMSGTFTWPSETDRGTWSLQRE